MSIQPLRAARRAAALSVIAAVAGCTSDASPPAAAAAPPPRGDIVIDGTRVFPESITSTSDGAVITGSLAGIIYRAAPGESVARPWIEPSPENGLRAVFGVLADERSGTLWACTAQNPFERPAAPAAPAAPTALVALDLGSGAPKAVYAFPPPGGICNDIAVAADGTVYATDTPGGRLLRLAAGSAALEVAGEDERLKGIDGLAFSGDGTLYVNLVGRGALLRVELLADGRVGELTELALSRPLSGPDGFRPIEGNRFLLAEGSGGRIDEVTIEGDMAQIRILKEGLDSSPGVTLVGDTAYAIEGRIGYLIDPELAGKDPGPFKAHAIPLR